MKLAIVNSDQRMQEVYFELSKDHETVLINEFTDFDRFHGCDALILPVKGLTSTGSLYTGGKELVLPASFWDSVHDVPIFTGITQAYLQDFPKVYYYMQEEEVKQKNAVYTAEGVLFLLIDNTGKCIQDLLVDIIGYGMCGQEIDRWLTALQVKHRIVRRECEEVDHFICVDSYRRMKSGDVIINTSISSLFDHELLCSMEHKPLMIDIATPDVIDYDTALKKGIRVIKAGNLPNMVAYQSAGKLIADYVRGKLHGRE